MNNPKIREIYQRYCNGDITNQEAFQEVISEPEIEYNDLMNISKLPSIIDGSKELDGLIRMTLFREGQPKCWRPIGTEKGQLLARRFGLKDSLVGAYLAEFLVAVDEGRIDLNPPEDGTRS